MKKFLLLGFVLLFFSLFASCSKQFELADIDSNESAILIPLEGDTTKQAAMDSLEFYEKNLISGKRIRIPYQKVAYGNGSSQNLPTHKLIKVSRAPVTRLWYNEGTTVGDKKGFATETKTSVGITIGLTVSARITEPAKFLYFKKSSQDFIKFLDDEMYSTAASIVAEIAASYSEADLISSKNIIAKEIQKRLNDVYSKFGIDVYSLGMYGGIIFDNPAIQAAIDEALIQKSKQSVMIAQAENDVLQQKNKVKVLEAEVAAARIRQQLVGYEREWLDVEMKRATVNYINSAAEKGLNLVPSTSIGDSS